MARPRQSARCASRVPSAVRCERASRATSGGVARPAGSAAQRTMCRRCRMGREPYAGLATTFDTGAELYERARPGYPRQLFADLAMSTGLRAAGARVLEVGAGTGQATRGLLECGWSVVALEPGR